MKLAISNIAWDTKENNKIVNILKDFGVKGVEVAPTKVCPEPENANSTLIVEFQQYWQSNNLELVAMQSLLFGKPHLSIFGDKQVETLDYLQTIIEMASALSTKALVFGSPKNRIVGTMDSRKARANAIEFFYALGDKAAQKGLYFCIEANPIAYGCDFLTETLEALKFVQEVNHPGMKLQIDTGTMFINKEEPRDILERCLPYIGHFHISEPHLNLVGNHDHTFIADCLKDLNYEGWVSIEMKNNALESDTIAVKAALEFVTKTYLQ
ncbi:D-psicose/D-tagatose/L-ribulose 3-epimerase [Paenibacillus sp. V4I9]|uniref:sugar phosphate isomerase/epimerase family protein n=1 Tax=Paenibacillus sp. V4I9 TaxID=3042308 RepID=UPI002781AB6E|nr:sugar phosphate isomerase/epimerase family protein [Paenibacillus sp. V4I9]MDQ0890931.1 D-psicose/D-tagatose/L-ribulose 3-epimerase [Paenibacillus sp. V4I9]